MIVRLPVCLCVCLSVGRLSQRLATHLKLRSASPAQPPERSQFRHSLGCCSLACVTTAVQLPSLLRAHRATITHCARLFLHTLLPRSSRLSHNGRLKFVAFDLAQMAPEALALTAPQDPLHQWLGRYLSSTCSNTSTVFNYNRQTGGQGSRRDGKLSSHRDQTARSDSQVEVD